MNYVGIDIGSTASKVVVRGDANAHFVLPTGWSSKETTKKIKEHLKELGADVVINPLETDPVEEVKKITALKP